MSTEPPLAGFLAKMKSHGALSTEDQAALLSLPFQVRRVTAGKFIIREGDFPGGCAILVEGFAFRQKIVEDGARQIVGIQVPGDALDLQQLHLDCADHNVQSLTDVTVAVVPRPAMRAVAGERPAVASVFSISNQIEGSIYREWLLNIGRRSALKRVAHLLCELAVRIARNEGVTGHAYELPLTQEQMGDALGLTGVHINRTLRELDETGLIVRDRRTMTIPDLAALQRQADFNPLYLHLGQQSAAL